LPNVEDSKTPVKQKDEATKKKRKKRNKKKKNKDAVNEPTVQPNQPT
jgi:hypothetical protein